MGQDFGSGTGSGLVSQIHRPSLGMYFGVVPSPQRIVGQVLGSGNSSVASRFATFSQLQLSVSGCQIGVEPGLQVVAAMQMNSALLGLGSSKS